MGFTWTGLEVEDSEFDATADLENKAKLLSDILNAYDKLPVFERGFVPVGLMRSIARAKKSLRTDRKSVV